MSYSDVNDLASNLEVLNTQSALAVHHAKASKKPKIEATGYCLFCEEPLEDGRRWCDAECRDDWQRLTPGK